MTRRGGTERRQRTDPFTPAERGQAFTPAEVTRRELTRLGLAVPTALGLAAAGAAVRAALAARPESVLAQGVCVLTPAQTEGPYWISGMPVRTDITEGLPGLPLQLQLQVVALPSCTPVPGATVEVWHCAADGRYSGFPAASGAAEGNPGAPGGPPPGGPGVPGGPPPAGGPGGPGAPGGGSGGVAQIPGESFLRGILPVDSQGSAEFSTIYPGWYTGRTPHIHVKVSLGGETLTSQMYFPDEVTNAVFGMHPYTAHPGRDVPTNEADGIFQPTGGTTILAIDQAGSSFVGRLLLGIMPGVAGLGQSAVTGGGPGAPNGQAATPAAGFPPSLRLPSTGGGPR